MMERTFVIWTMEIKEMLIFCSICVRNLFREIKHPRYNHSTPHPPFLSLPPKITTLLKLEYIISMYSFFFTFIIHVYNKNNINRVQKKWNPVKHDVTGLVKQRRGLEEDEGRCPWPVEVTQGTSYCRDG